MEPAEAASGGGRVSAALLDLPDREFVQIVCALRICFPQVGIVLSTRESAALRDALIPLGVTMMSAGSHTERLGGYAQDRGRTRCI